MKQFEDIISQFDIQGTVDSVTPLGNGLINRTYRVRMCESDAPQYVLQCINEAIFQDVPLLQSNIEAVTAHLRSKMAAAGVTDIDRRVLRFITTHTGSTFCRDSEGKPWRMSLLIPGSVTHEAVSARSAYVTGKAFGDFEAMLVDIKEPLGETIPDFHNMQLRITQLRDAVKKDAVGRASSVEKLIRDIEADADMMCSAERSYAAGLLPKRVCHCDTKVNNVLYDADTDEVLCVIDLDTVMPAYVFSDYGDFLRTAANTVAEDDPDIDKVEFRMDIFDAFTKGYLETATFLTSIERDNLPFAAALFPYMQCVRFLADYINGDTYYRITHPEHNLERALNQWILYRKVSEALSPSGRITWKG